MRECKGVVWGFSWLGATCWRLCRKTQKEQAKCLYSVLYTVYNVLFSPLWLKSVPPGPAISVSTWQQSRVGQIVWFGWLSAISQLASRGGREGECGNFVSIALHSLTLPGPSGESREGVVFPPLDSNTWECYWFARQDFYSRGKNHLERFNKYTVSKE